MARRPKRHAGPIWWIRGLAGCVILIMFGANLMVLQRLRADAMQEAAGDLNALAMTLAEHADRTIQGVELLLDGMARYGGARGATDTRGYDALYSTAAVTAMMRARTAPLPQVAYAFAVGLDGVVRGGTGAWPSSGHELSGIPYQSLLASQALDSLITPPVRSGEDGRLSPFLVRKVHGAMGEPIGFLLASLNLGYFERFYEVVSKATHSGIKMSREGGMHIVAFPPLSDPAAQPRPAAPRAWSWFSRQAGADDGIAWINSVEQLKSHDLSIATVIDQDVILKNWRQIAWALCLAAGVCAFAIIFASGAMERRWRHEAQQSEVREGRALAEAVVMRDRERNAENESRAKSGFLAMMSHEIRTPMNGVLGLAGTLLDTSLSDTQRRTIEAIRDSGDSLLRILNDILDFSKLDSGQMQFEETPFSPATLTQGPVSLLGPRAISKGLRITAICEDGLPAALLGDAGRISQVLLNVVSNAVKFTEHGNVTISAVCPERDKTSATIVWSVADTGIGIPADRIGRLFGEFVQADATITRRFGGSGLGLAISRRLIEQMGGSISVQSEHGKGTTFKIRLCLPITEPVREASHPPIDAAAAFRSGLRQLGRPMRILFAEDNPTNQFVALQMLQGFNVQTDVVADGLEAVQAAASFAYDVICMDMRMPEMDGLTATRAIRTKGGRLAAVPIVALTANAFPEDVAACYDSGMTGFLAKPVRKDALLSALLVALGAAAPGLQPVADTAPSDHALDHEAFAVLTNDIGEAGVSELVEMFVEETRTRLLLIANRQLDPVTLTREVHSLKGTAGAACAVLLAQRASALELRLTRGEPVGDADIAALRDAFEAWRQAAGTLSGTALATA